MAAEEPGIRIAKVWEDEHLVELTVTTSDGRSRFVSQAYTAHQDLTAAVDDLDRFRGRAFPALLDLGLGVFGSEHASGAFRGRLRLLSPGRLFVTMEQEGEHIEFGGETVASSAILHVTSEPGLRDRFASEMRSLARGISDEAWLQGI